MFGKLMSLFRMFLSFYVKNWRYYFLQELRRVAAVNQMTFKKDF
jgi:hypothetical protein